MENINYNFIDKSIENKVPYMMTIVTEMLMKQTDILCDKLVTISGRECEHIFDRDITNFQIRTIKELILKNNQTITKLALCIKK